MQNASADLDFDKIATQEDAAKVLDAELRSSSAGEPQPAGVAVALQVAADINDYAGLIDSHSRSAFPSEDTTPVPEQEHAVSPATENASTGGDKLHAKVD